MSNPPRQPSLHQRRPPRGNASHWRRGLVWSSLLPMVAGSAQGHSRQRSWAAARPMVIGSSRVDCAPRRDGVALDLDDRRDPGCSRRANTRWPQTRGGQDVVGLRMGTGSWTASVISGSPGHRPILCDGEVAVDAPLGRRTSSGAERQSMARRAVVVCGPGGFDRSLAAPKHDALEDLRSRPTAQRCSGSRATRAERRQRPFSSLPGPSARQSQNPRISPR